MILHACGDELASLDFLFKIVGYLLKIVQWVIPIILIVLVTIDVLKVIISDKDDEKKKLLPKVLKRLIYAIIIFLIPILVKFLLRSVAGNLNQDKGFIQCIDYILNQ